jgi:hypothetical protein
MANTYYDSDLTGEQIEQALKAIAGVIVQANNGKVLAINNGKIEARSVQWGGGSTLEPLSVTANGDYTPGAGVDGFDEVHVSVPNSYTASDEGKVVSNGALVAQTARASQITQNGTYDTTLNDEVTVNVSGGGSAVVQPLSVTQNGTYNPPSGVDGYAPVTVNVSGGGSGFVADEYSQFLNSVFDTNAPIESGNTIEVAFYANAYVNDGHIVGQSYNSSGSAFHLTTYSNRWYIGGTSEANFAADSDCPLSGADIVYRAKTGEISMNGVIKTTNFTMPNRSNNTYKLNTRGGAISTIDKYKYKYVKVYDSNDDLVCFWEFGHLQLENSIIYLAHEKVQNIYKGY